MGKTYQGTWESVKTHAIPQWYEDCKLGIFIHWGIYSVPAYAPRTWELGEVPSDEEWFCNNPYAEWYYNSVNVGRGPTYEHHVKTYGKDFAYEDFLQSWEAEKWEPAKWASLFKEAGAGYVVLTAKHHDGFCLFPSKHTGYHSVNRGPKRDLTGELTQAVRESGMKMGLYYSGIIDWTYAHDPIFEESDNFYKACPTFAYADYAYKQSCELIDTYQPSVFWNDIGWPRQGEGALPYLLAHYYNTVEDGVVNDRFNGLYKGYSTKEYKAGEANRKEKWEMCRGMGLSFGYNANEGDDQLLSVEELISLLTETVANNGNLLLNIGPKADGTIPQEQEKRLLAMGEWLKTNGEAIFKTRCSSRRSESLDNGIKLHFTKKGRDLYILVDQAPPGQFSVTVPQVEGTPQALDPTVEFSVSREDGGITLHVRNYRKEQCALAFRVPEGEM